MKKFLSIALCLCLLAQMVGVLGVAAEPLAVSTDQTCGDAVYWDLTNGVLTISGTGPMANYTYFGEQPPWLGNASDVRRIVIEEGVTSIGQCAFSSDSYSGENCVFSNLTDVEIANTVTMIRMNAFAECVALESIEIPASVTDIECAAFVNCTAMKGFNVDENNTAYKTIGGVLFTKDGSTLVAYPIGLSATEYHVPDSTRTIAPYAVCLGANLKEVYFNEGLVFIDDEAFLGCTGLTKIELPNSLKKLGGGVFQECTSLYDITLPKTIEKINAQVFTNTAYYNDRNNWEEDVLYIGNALLTGTYLYDDVVNNDFIIKEKSGTLTVKEGTTIIAAEAFFLTGVTEVRFPETLQYIGDGAFYASDLIEVILPDSLLVLEDSAFHSCESLVSVTMGPNLKRIGSGVFNETAYTDNAANYIDGVLYNGSYLLDYNTSLPDDVVIREGTTLMAEQAFFHESGYIRDNYGSTLKTVTIPQTLTTISERAFLDCNSLMQVTIPETVTEIHKEAFGYDWSYDYELDRSVFTPRSNFLMVCYADSAAERYAIENGIAYEYAVPKAEEFTYTIENGEATVTGYTGSGGDVVIPSTLGGCSVRSIGKNAFHSCSQLVSVTIPEGVTDIAPSAFFGCANLTAVTLPNSVISIGNGAFRGCKSLASITIPNNVTTIEDCAFYDCSSLPSVTIPGSVTSMGGLVFYYCTGLTSVTILEGITCVEGYTFVGCRNLISVTIPNSVTEIGAQAFRGCTSLTSITIPNGVTKIGSYTFDNCASLVSINIPKGVTDIWGNTFSGCSHLTDVWYGGTQAEREDLYIGKSNDPLLSATWHYVTCQTGEHAYSGADDMSCDICGTVRTLVSIAVTTLPSEVSYLVGSGELYVDGGKVTVSYNDGTCEVIDLTAEMVSGFDNTVVGEQQVTVTYGSVSTTFPITILGMDAPQFVVEDVTAKAGDTVTVAVKVKNNPGIVSTKLEIGYDANVLELISGEWQDFTGGVSGFSPFTVNPFVVNWTNTLSGNNTTDGVLALLTFKVKDDAAAGDTVITVSYDPDDVYDENWDNVSFATVAGTVTVIEYISGDANGDGKVNNKDLGLLLQYLNKWDVTVVEPACDVNRDGKVNNKDLGLLLQYLNGWAVELK